MAEQSFLVDIPRQHNAAIRQTIGQSIIFFIVNRTGQGLDKFNKPFKPYSKSYTGSLEFIRSAKAQALVNLRVTGEMLARLTVVSHGVGFIKIGFSDATANDKAEFNLENGRDFLGITLKDLEGILFGFPIIEAINTNISPSISSPIVRGINGN